MARKKLPIEYDPDIRINQDVRGAPIADALATLYRSSRINEEVLREISELARKGYTLKAIAARVGMGYRTLTSWISRGERRREEIDDWVDRMNDLPSHYSHEQIVAELGEPPQEDDLLAIYDAVARSAAGAECDLVDVVMNDALLNQSTSSAKWMLNSRYGWNSKVRVERDDSNHTVDADVLSALDKKLSDYEAKQNAMNYAAEPTNETTQS